MPWHVAIIANGWIGVRVCVAVSHASVNARNLMKLGNNYKQWTTTAEMKQKIGMTHESLIRIYCFIPMQSSVVCWEIRRWSAD